MINIETNQLIKKQIILLHTLHGIECRYKKKRMGVAKKVNITDLARDELNKVLQTEEANGIRVYFNGFG